MDRSTFVKQAESSRGMVVASLYSYVLSVVGGSKSEANHFQPLAVAAFSAGRLVAAPLFGWMMDKLPLRLVVLTTIIVSLIGHVAYIFCGNIASADVAASGIIVSRCVVGLGSGASVFKAQELAPLHHSVFSGLSPRRPWHVSCNNIVIH